MSVFGFIENFFLISLGIVFGLVVLLVYHFKNRMAIAEKKSDSMYGLISAVVKEIKMLRGLFGIGNEKANNPATELAKEQFVIPTSSVKSKTDPEIEVVDLNMNESHYDKGYDNKGNDAKEDSLERNVITLDFNASEPNVIQKIVVSDDEDEDNAESDSDTESELESETESESELELESESDDEDEEEEEEDVVEEEPLELESETLDVNLVDVPSQFISNEITMELQSNEVDEQFDKMVELQSFSVTESEEINLHELVEKPKDENVLDQSLSSLKKEEDKDIVPAQVVPSVDLRKMNINQLKTIAIQSGITVDTSKMKKHELITIIQSKQNTA